MGWSGIAALGEMAKGAGGYFGTLNTETVKTQRLAEARAQEVADRDEGRVYAEKMHGESTVAAKAALEEKRGYDEGRVDEGRTYDEKIAAEARAQSLVDSRQKQEDAIELQRVKDGGTAGGKKTASQVTHETRTKQAEVAYAELDKIMETYDPGSAQGGWDQLTVGGMTNILASKEGQQYQSAAGRVKEAFLRAATGAAAPETENKSYINMFVPQFGDSPETKEAKKLAMREQIAIMQSAYPSGGDTPQDVIDAQMEMSAMETLAKYKLDAPQEAAEQPAAQPAARSGGGHGRMPSRQQEAAPQAQQAQPSAPPPPKVGEVVDGMVFNGGDPANPSNWSMP